MATTYWSERFFETTRGRIVRLLRGETRTVSELARVLELTANAVRGHLATLERDGYVERAGVRRGRGKPAHLYRLTSAAERGFSRAYAPVLATVLETLDERLEPAQVQRLLDAVGRRAAAAVNNGEGGLDERVAQAVSLLEALGAAVEVEEADGVLFLQGGSCPLGELNGQHEKACRIVRSLLIELTDRPVRERCERGERPRCAFEVSRAAGGAG